MKKRLLSAALALAMALTLLPLSVFAATADGKPDANGPVDGVTTIYYTNGKDSSKLDASGNIVTAGWAWSYQDSSNGNKTVWASSQSLGGIVAGTSGTSGVWYSSSNLTNATTGALRTNNFTLLSDLEITSTLAGTNTSFQINTFGKNLTFGSGVLNTINQVTITDTASTKGSVSGLSRDVGTYTSGTPATTMSATGLTLQITDASVTGGISLKGRSNTVTLNHVNVSSSGITLDGTTTVTTTAGSNKTYDRQSLTINAQTAWPYEKSEVTGSIAVTGTGSVVNLNGVTAGSSTVTMTSTGGTLTLGNGTTTGAITVNSDDNRTTTSAPPAVTINDATVGGYTYTAPANNTALSSLIVNNQGKVSGAISTDNGNVTIHSANVGNITVKTGTLAIDGTNGTAGNIELCESGKVTFNFSGTGYTLGDIEKKAGGILTIGSNWPTGRSNTFGELKLNDYAGNGVKGGIFKTSITSAGNLKWISTDLQFARLTSGGTYAYYGTRELATAIADAGSAAATQGTISVLGSTASKYVGFYNSLLDVSSDNAIALLGYGADTGIYLPDKINGTSVATWTSDTGAKTYGVNEEVPISLSANDIKLVIQSSGAAVSKLTNVTAAGGNNNVTATLSNNQITLSGAVGQGAYENVTLTLTTDLIGSDGKAVTFKVLVSYNTSTKTSAFSTLGLDAPPQGVVVNSQTIVVGSNTYTLSTTGLAKPAANLKVAGIDSGLPSGMAGNSLVATINVSGLGNASKQELADDIAGTGASFKWTDSPAMSQAVNQALASITSASQVDNWATAAQRAAWTALGNTGKTPSDTDLSGTGYTTVVLEPYLAVNVNGTYNASGTMTAALVPSYRVVVVSTVAANMTACAGKTGFTAEGYYIAQQGRALNTPITDLTDSDGDNGVEISFSNGMPSGFNNAYMHQDDTYVYAPASSKWTITRAGKTGLGTVTLNSTPALVNLERSGSNTTNGKKGTMYYDNLQAAVNDTLPQTSDSTLDKITVTAAYTGSGVIDVTGTARTFKIETLGQTTITNANNNFTVGVDSTGHGYTVQLQKSVASATGEVEVAVNTAQNGYATSNLSKAKVGSTVTITATPNTGYQAGVTAKTNTGAAVSVTNNGNNTFTFTVPAGATRVDVTPVFVATSGLPFTDVSTSDSFYNAVKWNYDNQYIQGTTATTFRPNNYLTRGQIVLILYRHAGSPTVSYTSYPYTDMPTYDAEMCRAIIWATNTAKIVEGYGNGLFGPGNNVRNQELAKILYLYNAYRGKAVGSTSVNLSSYFTDASSISSWAVPYVQWAVANGVMGPTTGKLFQPQLQLQRYQAAVDIYNYGLRFGA